MGNQQADSIGYGTTSGKADYHLWRRQLHRITEAIAKKQRVPKALKQSVVDVILSECVRSGDTSGKWMFQFKKDWIDHYWNKIARATADGRLGCSAKVAPAADLVDPQTALICVYVDDFRNRADVKRVLLELQGMGFHVRLGFKPDIFTELGMYRGNEWRLSPAIYSVEQVMADNFVTSG